MSELTLKAIELLLDAKFKEELKPINSSITAINANVAGMKTDISSIKTVVAHLATTEELQSTNTRLGTIEGILNMQTTALATLTADTKKVLDEKTVSARRFERLEQWAEQVGQKLGIKLEL